MAVKTYTWNAQAVADTWTILVDDVGTVGDVIGVTINGKTVTYTIETGDDEADAAEGLRDALLLSTIPEFRELSWSVDTDTVTGTASVEGVPHVLTAYETGTADVTVTNTVAATGPEFVDDTANWSGGTLPANSDDIVIPAGRGNIRYGLTALSSVTAASVRIASEFTGDIGLPEMNPNGYPEYRDRYLTLGGNPTVSIGEGNGRGSQLINLSVGTGSCAITVHKTGPRRVGTSPALNLANGGGNNTLVLNSGDVGIAAEQGTTAAFQNVRVGQNPSVQLHCGTGATLTNIIQNGGHVTVNSAVTSLIMNVGAQSFTQAAGANTASVIYGGVFYADGTGTYSSLTVRKINQTVTPRIEFGRDPRAKTVTTAVVLGGAVLSDPHGVIATWSTFQFDHVSLAASNVGPLVTLSRTA